MLSRDNVHSYSLRPMSADARASVCRVQGQCPPMPGPVSTGNIRSYSLGPVSFQVMASVCSCYGYRLLKQSRADPAHDEANVRSH